MNKKPTYEELEQRVLDLEKFACERKQAEEEIRNEQNFCESLIETAQAIILVLDPAGRIVQFNPYMETLSGYRLEEVKGKDWFSTFLPARNGDQTKSLFRKAIDDIQTRGNVNPIITKDGREIFIEWYDKTLKDRDGNTVGLIAVGQDITKRKRAAESLRKSEQRYSLLFNNSNDAVFVHRIDKERFGNFIEINDVACTRLGYTREEFLKMSPVDIDAGGMDEARRRALKVLTETGQCIFEMTHVGKFENKIPVEISARIFESEGALCVLSIAREITERKKTEEALRESEKKFRRFFEDDLTGDYISTAAGIILECNPAFLCIFGYKSKAEAVGESITALYPELSERDSIIDQLRVTGKLENYETIRKRKDGSLMIVNENIVAMFDENHNIAEIKGYVYDITERKQAEENLRESELKYKTLTEKSIAGIFIHQDDKYLFVNDKFAEMHGYKAEELIGKCHYDLVHPDQKEVIKQRGHRRLSGEKVPNHYEIKRIRKDGEAVWHEIMLSDPVDYKGKPAIMGDEIDITERKQLESHLQKAQKMEAIGTLAGGIAHDFNNILFPIMCYTEMLLEDTDKSSPNYGSLNEIFTATKRASELVKQILAFSRERAQELKPLKIQHIIKEILKLVRSSLPQTIAIRQNIPNETPLVMADPTQIHQVLMNLMTNAYHAMEENGGTLDISLSEVLLEPNNARVPDLPPGEYVCLSVQDTGDGMDVQTMERIFDPYFSTKETGKGTGLGLAIVHGIAKSHGGDIQVQSEPGKGSTFTMYLPALKTTAKDTNTIVLSAIVGGTERILLVDDEEVIARMGQQMLERLGYQVTARTSSVEALEAFRANPERFDLIVTDMTMPNMTGIQFAREVKNINPNIPVIVCTGFSEQINEKNFKALGIDGYVLKPIIRRDIAEVIRKALDKPEEN
jgi:PAS domain S-box-containing protein